MTVLFLAIWGCSGSAERVASDQSVSRFSVLVFTKTDPEGFRHDSISDGIRAVADLGKEYYFAVDATEDAAVFSDDSLEAYEAVIFLNTSGNVFDDRQQAAFERYIQSGGGFVGVHGAAATEYDWPWYRGLVGAVFDDHPEIQEARIDVVQETDPSTRHLPSPWHLTGEWYNFRADPSDSVDVLLQLDESSYDGGTMGEQHPIAWKHAYDGGRSFYTGLGHSGERFEDERFRKHLLKGIEWTAGGHGDFVEDDFPFITTTVDARNVAPFMPDRNVAVRSIVLQLGNETYASFDPDLLRMSAGWQGDFVSMTTMAQVSYHQAGQKENETPRLLGQPIIGTGIYAGWSIGAPSFEDPRQPGPNPNDPGRGPLPRDEGRWKGLRVSGEDVVLSYEVGDASIREYPGSVAVDGQVGITRTFELTNAIDSLTLVAGEVRDASASTRESSFVTLAHGAAEDSLTAVGLINPPSDARLEVQDERYLTLVLSGNPPTEPFTVVMWTGLQEHLPQFEDMLRHDVNMPEEDEMESLYWPRSVSTRGERATDSSAFVRDDLSLPMPNPWGRNVRVADLAFFDDGRAAIVTFSGDVWLVSGIDQQLEEIRWKRYASGLYEPLSLSIVDGEIYVYGREGIVRLEDNTGNGEADVYMSFTDGIIQSMETREWPLDMVVRPHGGFYVSMGGALAAGPPAEGATELVPGFRTGSRHAGTVLRVSEDGEDVEVYADGFREPYLGIFSPQRLLTASDQQGNFVPSTPIYAVREGAFYGVPATRQLSAELPKATPPITWIPHQVDPSGSSQLWIDSDQMGPLNNSMLHLSYARPGPFRVYVDSLQQPWQGGVSPLPGEYDVPTIKAQVHPQDGQVYMAGFQVWGSRAERISSISRLRYSGQPSSIPVGAAAGREGVLLTFDEPLDAAMATEPSRYAVRRWNYERTSEYGSRHFMLNESPGEEPLRVAEAHLSDDQRTVLLVIADMQPVMQMAINYDIRSQQGEEVRGPTYLTMHSIRPLELARHGFADFDPELALERAEEEQHTVATDTSGEDDAVVSVERGERIYQEVGCVTCHASGDDEAGRIGPTFADLFESQRRLESGNTVVADADYLRRAILDPARDVVEGYPANMPSYEGILNESEVESLILYIESLEEGGSGR